MSWMHLESKLPEAQARLREALNDWLGDPRLERPVLAALAEGARLDQAARPGANASILHACASMAFDPAQWESLARLCQASQANIDALDHERSTALHFAARSGNAAAVQALLTLGASALRLDRSGLLPIHRCCGLEDPSKESDYGRSLESLLRAAPQTATARLEPQADRFVGREPDDYELWDPEQLQVGSPIHFACRSGMREAPGLLQAFGADLDEREPITGLRPLEAAATPERAAQAGIERVAIELVRHGCAVELDEDPFGAKRSPLRLALAQGWTGLAKALVGRGASVDGPSARGSSPEPLSGLDFSQTTDLLETPQRSGALSFWRGFMDMVHDERSIRASLERSAESASKIAKRSMRV